jgi:hypothetical protein
MTYFAFTYSKNSPNPQLALSKNEYDDLVLAREIDFSQVAIENKYQLLLDNYVEFEEDLLRFSLNWAIRTPDPWDALRIAHQLFDRRVLNFLSSARMYLDQIPGVLSTASLHPEVSKEFFKQKTSDQYDSSLAYRVCEALRNYTQHKDLPVHGVSHGFRREPDDVNNIIVNYSGLHLDISKLESDGKFKSKVLDELRKEKDRPDLKNYLRLYMHSLGLIHLELRKSLNSDSEWAIGLIRNVVARVKALPSVDAQSFVFLAIGAEDGTFEPKGPIDTDRFDYRRLLESRTRLAPHLTQVQVSSE